MYTTSGTCCEFPEGSTVYLYPQPGTGWHFDHWEFDLTGNANPGIIVMNSNKSVSCVYVQDTGNSISVTGPSSYNFGAVIAGSCSAPTGAAWTVTANGSSYLTVIINSSNSNDFPCAGFPNACGTFSMGPGDSHTVLVKFCPTSATNLSSNLVISCSTTGQTFTYPLTGTGTGGGANGSCSFQGTGPFYVGDVLSCQFTWTGASQHSGGYYALSTIYTPTGYPCASGTYTTPSGTSDLSDPNTTCLTTAQGTYTGEIDVYDGSGYVMHTCSVNVLPNPGPTVVATLNVSQSTFNLGPFTKGQMNATIATISLGNIGTQPGEVYIKYFYMNTTGQWIGLNATPFSVSIPSGGTVSQTHTVNIPSDIQTGSVYFGVKVWGYDETEPACLSPTGASGGTECINGYSNTCTVTAPNTTGIWMPTITACTGCTHEGVTRCINGYLNTCTGGTWTPTTTPCTGLEYEKTAIDNNLIIGAAALLGVAGLLWYTKKKKMW
jgi:hypothetical protein